MGRLVELASCLAQEAEQLETFFASSGRPIPSFSVENPTDVSYPPDISRIRQALLDQTDELRDLVLGPRESIVNWQYNYLLSLHAAAELGLAKSFPVGSSTTYEAMAHMSGYSIATVRRVIRHAITNRCFAETADGSVIHTSLSRMLAEDAMLPDYIAIGYETASRVATYTVASILKYPESQEVGQSAFSIAHQSDRPAYEIMAANPKLSRRFMNCMAMNSMDPGLHVHYILNTDLWERLPDGALLVDVGGSHGELAFTVARAQKHINVVVQDLDATIKSHPPIPPELAGRIRFVAHDFFKPQPDLDANVYLFRWIFHNWPDESCIKVLRNLAPALRPGVQVLVNEICMPELGILSNRDARKIHNLDMGMLTFFNSRERYLSDWKNLFHCADTRFSFVSVVQPEGAHLSILQFQWN